MRNSPHHFELHPGQLAEALLRNAISIGEGSALILLQRPMSLALLVVIVLVMALPRLLKKRS
jgi:putative tricarboxylic transport membrane protein